jgi:hypothetical protein
MFSGEANKKCAYNLTFQSFDTFFTDWLRVFGIETYINTLNFQC